MKSSRSEKEKMLNIQKQIQKQIGLVFDNIVNLKKIQEIQEKNNTKGITIQLNCIVMFSGGPDSCMLLNQLKYYIDKLNVNNLDIVLHGIHLNHNIRTKNGEAKRDEEFSKKMFEINNMKYKIYNEDILENAKTEVKSTETYARERRYFLVEEYINELIENENSIAKKIYIVFTGHNADDNAETIFMNILRGSGTKGIEGIKSVTKGNDVFNTSKRSNIYLAKPLKDTYKSEILRYLDFFNLEYMIDSTNLENEYFRNIVRNDIFPYIQKNTNFDIKKGLNTLSQNIFKQNTYINNLVVDKFNNIRIINSDTNKGVYLDLDKLKKEDEYIIKEICIYAFNTLKIIKDISKQNIEDIYNLICNGINGKKLYPTKFCKVGIKKINNIKVLYIFKI